jgi:pyruvoyl-dependent arginine decarboxylase (PvlArgDC)
MASIAVLRMKGKLDKLLPASLLPPSTVVARQDSEEEGTRAAAAMGMHR